MNFCLVNSLLIVNKIVLLTLHLNITHSAIITRMTTKQIEKLKCGGEFEKSPFLCVAQKMKKENLDFLLKTTYSIAVVLKERF